MAGRVCFLIAILAAARARRVSVSDQSLDAEDQEQDARSLESLTQKYGDGLNFTVSMSIAHGNAIGKLSMQFRRGGTQVTNKGFSNEAASSEYWRSGSALGKDDDYVWEVQSDVAGGSSASFTFDHGVSDLVFGDLLVESDEEFFRMEFEETAYQKVQPQSAWLFQQPVEDAVGQHLREEIRESSLRVGDWHPDGYFLPRRDRAMMSYTPRLMAKKSVWEDAGGKFKKVVMQRPAIMDIDLLFGEEEMPMTRTVRKSMDVVRDRKYKGKQGNFPSLGTCKDSDSVWDQAHKTAGYFCGRTSSEQCSTAEECDKLGGRWKPKYCMAAKKGSPGQEPTCGCCKDIGRDEPVRSGGPMSVQLHVQWFAPVVTRFQCAPVEAKWAKTGASSLFIGMGWGTEGDVEGLDIDLSLVPLNKRKEYIKDKVIYFNNKQPNSLRCSQGSYGYAMQAFADDRSGDAPGDDELVKINLKCLTEQHTDIETVVVLASIYRPQRLTWNMLDSVYMRLVSGGHEEQRGSSFFVHDADSLRSFVRLSGDAQKANPVMESTSLAVGMLFKEASGEWAFAGLMEGLKGTTAMHVQKPLEKFMQTLNYPISQDWDAEIDDEEDVARTEPCVEVIG
mmetsp:Transcript_10984/g.29428  ORF Transcript_10984/g.29428 Transcript_10984/m.29428 type:complete len:617 (+) Transcript_10984:98-1948(+)